MKGFKFLAMLSLVAFFVVGCATTSNKGATKSSSQPLIWYMLGDTYDDAPKVYEKANEIIKKNLGLTVDFKPISIGEYKQKMDLKAAASESFDLCYTSDGGFAYYDNVRKGTFIAIDDLLEKNAPKLKALVPENLWKAVKIDQKIYAVPNYQVSFRQGALVFNKALVEKYKLKDKIDQIQRFEDLTPILQVIKDNETAIYGTTQSPFYYANSTYGKDEFFQQIFDDLPIGIDYSKKALNLTEGKYYDEQMKILKLRREWYKKGFYHPDAGIAKSFTAEIKAGKFFMTYDSYKPGCEADYEQRNGYPVYVKPFGLPILSSGSIQATMTAISRTSKNPEGAMKVLEFVNSDKELYNLLAFGIQGQHYKKTGPDRVEVIPNAKYGSYQWSFGCQFNAYKLPLQADNVWEETIRMNKSAVESPSLGFQFNIEPVKAIVTNIRSIQKEYTSLTYCVTADFEKLANELFDKQKAAGLSKVVEEVQKQLDAWQK